MQFLNSLLSRGEDLNAYFQNSTKMPDLHVCDSKCFVFETMVDTALYYRLLLATPLQQNQTLTSKFQVARKHEDGDEL